MLYWRSTAHDRFCTEDRLTGVLTLLALYRGKQGPSGYGRYGAVYTHIVVPAIDLTGVLSSLMSLFCSPTAHDRLCTED
jgi:hypothetical protein